MITFEVKDMTCQHCVATIFRAVAEVDERAVDGIDLSTHRVAIESRTASAQSVSQSIKDAGYSLTVSTLTPVTAARKKAAAAAVERTAYKRRSCKATRY